MARRNNRSLVKPNANVAANARRIVAAQTAAFFAQERYLNDPNASTELHAMRIAAKRLRYTMELFSAVLGSDVEGCLDAIREFQEIAGEIHDADARAGVFREYLYARVTDQADMLAALAAGAAGEDMTDTAIDAFKIQARAEVTAEAWVSEQVALAAAIARALGKRRERYADLRAQWAEWQTADLRGRLDALGNAAVEHKHTTGEPVVSAAAAAQEPEQEAMPAGE